MKIEKSPVQVSHLLLPITKRLHYFYANQAYFQHLANFVFSIRTKYQHYFYVL